MKIATLSIVVGSEACNAACPFCVSKMTPPNGIQLKEPPIRWDRLRKALQFAEMMNVTTVILTGKGEPTLFKATLLDYVTEVGPRFPFVELQTNGLTIGDGSFEYLSMMSSRGLTTVALSVVSHEEALNKKVYLWHRPNAEYPNLAKTIERIHEAGLSVRLSVTMIRGGVENGEALRGMILFARKHGVEQISIRPVASTNYMLNEEVWNCVEGSRIHTDQLEGIQHYLKQNGRLLLTLQHGAEVYDVHGQNVCLTDCLTLPKGEEIRQAIFFPDGHLRYDWQYPGAILM